MYSMPKKGYSYETFIGNSYKSQIAYVGNSLYKRLDNSTFNNTGNIYKHINQYTTDVFNNYKINKTHNVKKTYCNFINDVVINKHNTINTNDTYNVAKIIKLVNSNYDSYISQRKKNIKVISLIISQDITITIMSIM